MILSASRRTDIPAFYADWFFNRIKEGYVCVRNPMNVHQVSSISLSPDVVDCIVFWTKNPAPMLRRIDELKDYDYYFQYTLNAYDKDAEPGVPPLGERIQTFRELSGRIGKERVIWRYDPIIFTDRYDPAYHLEQFTAIAGELAGYTEKCVFSFVDIYPTKNQKNLRQLNYTNLGLADMEPLLSGMTRVAKECGLALATCAERVDLSRYGIEHNSCIDGKLIERITGCSLKTVRDEQRADCHCVKCDDIGSYDTCTHMCAYCYANFRHDIVREKAALYDPDSPLLCDSIVPGEDKVTKRSVKSMKLPPEAQLRLF